ncbi:hypothetical protein [Chryseobacterium gwangjuense]|uniref:hypothetical protein n=1 Tax=Chryseobacterium gwangjuense TaxID=1069980 RepID=UPI001E56DF1C|nr:hypothetical protein [Chryseobacterium gwangjuense]MCE3075331.1 hypothetical protein [Chryseobacterium gwangjuense]
MSLTYHLKFRKKLENKKQLTELIDKYKNNFFAVSNLYSTNQSYEEGKFQDQYLNIDLADSSKISFDVLRKEADPLLWKELLQEIVYKITTEIYPNEDYFFDFQGDIVYELRENGVIKKNNIDLFI